MRVLVACEYSGRVRDAFIRAGHEAMSCDLLDTEAPGPHYVGDVRDVIGGGWDLMISHPPCTYLASSGLHWNKRVPGRAEKTQEALSFVRMLLDAPIPKIALENPIGCISTNVRRPDQTVQPWMFGEDASKATCFWLKNLPPLVPTSRHEGQYGCKCGHRFPIALGKYGCPNCAGKNGAAKVVYANQTNSGQNNLSPGADRWKERSRTFQGIADAMADQWGGVVSRAGQADLFAEAA